ncbi:MAG: outer membrane beta-barrel domain-containing protein [Gammaproteobacteria bacterium]|nr:outer membrane beta-barrel domain-containing protein [Gammaproteobacteria bacterium]MCZ6854980.1 outer membrane beta-barrel domain-containing protein [Gammaproteobacteria bacterium]
MESRIQHILLTTLLVLGAPGAIAASGSTNPIELELEPLVVREPERREVDVAALDQENFEIGVMGGLMSVEDFGSNTVMGARIAYHVTEDFFVEGQYGKTTLGQTSFERLSGGAQILTDDERDMTYYNVSVGYNVFPGEAFLGRGLTFKGGLYVVAGVGSTNFGGDDRFTINAGVGYRLIATDWLAFHLDVRDHVFETDLLGTQETKHNIEFSGGLTFFF